MSVKGTYLYSLVLTGQCVELHEFMATTKQKKLARALIDNVVADDPLNKQQLVESVGYSALTADRLATKVIGSRGVREELVLLGFNESTAKEVVAEILIGGENDTVKLKAAEIVFKVHGSFAPSKHLNVNVDVDTDDPVVKELTNKLNAIHGSTSFPSNGEPSSTLGTEA